MFEEDKKGFMKCIQNICNKGHNFVEVFNDFIKCYSIELQNITKIKDQDYTERDRIFAKYTPDEKLLLADMGGIMGYALYKEIGDFCGEIFMEQSMNDKKFKAQVFTPFHTANAMSKMIDDEKTKQILDDHKVVLAHDPCVGAGVFPIAYAKRLKEMGYNYAEQLLFVCIDLDPICVEMAYVQLSLLGIPAVIYEGNTLTLEMKRELHTPALVFNWMHFKPYLEKAMEIQND